MDAFFSCKFATYMSGSCLAELCASAGWVSCTAYYDIRNVCSGTILPEWKWLCNFGMHLLLLLTSVPQYLFDLSISFVPHGNYSGKTTLLYSSANSKNQQWWHTRKPMILNLGLFQWILDPWPTSFKHLVWNLTVMICKSSKERWKSEKWEFLKSWCFTDW